MQRLRDLGWIESRNVAIEYRWAEGLSEHFAEIATELVRLKVDVIVTLGVAGRGKTSDVSHPNRIGHSGGPGWQRSGR